jgi:hypothetical protein
MWKVPLYDDLGGHGIRLMKLLATILTIGCMVTLLHTSQARAGNTMTIAGQSSPIGPTNVAESDALKSDDAAQSPSLTAGSSTSSTVFPGIPSINGRYSVGGTTLMPYLGAGFGSGYASQLDRSLNSSPSMQTDSSLRSLFGQGLAPNEFQMGVRIPF